MADADWLKEHELYRDLTYDDIRNIGEYCIEQSFRKGEPIVNEGDPHSPGMAFIKSGSANVSVKVKSVDKPLAYLRPGEFFGEISLVQPDTPRSASVVAAADTTVLLLSVGQYERLKRDRPSTVFRMLEIFLRATGDRLRRTSRRVQ